MLDAMARNESLGSTASTRTQKTGLREVCSKCDGGSRAYPYAQQEAPQAAHADRPVHTGRSPIAPTTIRLVYDWYVVCDYYTTIIPLLRHYLWIFYDLYTTLARLLQHCYIAEPRSCSSCARGSTSARRSRIAPTTTRLLPDYYATTITII